MPAGFVPAIVAVAVLVTIAAALDWLVARPAALVLLLVVIFGSLFLWVRRKRARNRV
jgi:hypothetical protein